jgi:hypothetical protein
VFSGLGFGKVFSGLGFGKVFSGLGSGKVFSGLGFGKVFSGLGSGKVFSGLRSGKVFSGLESGKVFAFYKRISCNSTSFYMTEYFGIIFFNAAFKTTWNSELKFSYLRLQCIQDYWELEKN